MRENCGASEPSEFLALAPGVELRMRREILVVCEMRTLLFGKAITAAIIHHCPHTVKQLPSFLLFFALPDISRPHIFAKFDFHPYCSSNARDATVPLPSAAKVKRAMRRLDFWASAAIAPLVRECAVTPWPRSSSKSSTTDQPLVLLTAFFEKLVRFVGVQIIRATGVYFTQTGVSNLCLLPNLRSLCITKCRTAPGKTIEVSPLKFQRLSNFEFGGSGSPEKLHIWIPLLRPDHLRELAVDHPLLHALLYDFNLLPSFPYARKLSVKVDLSKMSLNLALLSRFPALAVLSMEEELDTGPLEGGYVAPPGFLPLLKEYTGVHQTLELFLLPSLTHLTISSYCQPRQAIAKLQAIQSPNNVTTLRVSFESLKNAVFHDFCGFFPALTTPEYDWEVEPEWEIPEFLETLARSASLPPRHTQLALFWTTECMYSESPPEYANFRTAIMKKYPGLDALWMGLYGFTSRFRKISDGKVLLEDAIADDNHDTVKSMCSEFDASWDALDVHV
ncbi:hypothetical protein B0H17DRAFT_1148054 [Mycena rosella]|uniref:Uncharacterized protein n=1 Tax=Mycena rosella TaxID=1033263 RepID=A0AAD7FXN8_MYCRO|nr:hypothetical protein B0H17DRAFT_1148054 [Mycena rosella]